MTSLWDKFRELGLSIPQATAATRTMSDAERVAIERAAEWAKGLQEKEEQETASATRELFLATAMLASWAYVLAYAAGWGWARGSR